MGNKASVARGASGADPSTDCVFTRLDQGGRGLAQCQKHGEGCSEHQGEHTSADERRTTDRRETETSRLQDRQQLERTLASLRQQSDGRQVKVTATPVKVTAAGVKVKGQVAPLQLSFPGVCRRYSSRQGCEDPDCKGLHVCVQFLVGICNYGQDCRSSHTLTTVHNQGICTQYGLDTTREQPLLQQIRRAFEESGELTEALFVHNLSRCYWFRSKTPCKSHECNRIHICRFFLTDQCARDDCKMGHDLHTAHNNEVLQRHRLTHMGDGDILDILREKEQRRKTKANHSANTGKTSASAGTKTRAGAGAVPRKRLPISPRKTTTLQVKSGQRKHQPPDTAADTSTAEEHHNFSEELQCPICLELFNMATTLGCGHTFCSGCLHGARTKSRDDKCPMCSAVISSTIRSVALDNIIRSMTKAK